MPAAARILWAFLVVAAGTIPATALDWDTDTVRVTIAPFQATQEVVFRFRNRGSTAASLTDIQTNCDCLSAAADRTTVSPGESGLITATFTVGDRAGLYERVITVRSDDAREPMRLHVEIEVPETCSVAPRSLQWKLNAGASAQTVTVTAAAGLTIDFTEAVATNPAFVARLETVAAGRTYRVHVQPTDTARPISAAIRIFGRDKSGHAVVASAYATVE
ncbi:MAG TPA: DUF1573 domain-containing protein [Lacunisphaera sp.]|nr:DUF1573 domain-containing protein [Lacunisphaera sp.]